MTAKSKLFGGKRDSFPGSSTAAFPDRRDKRIRDFVVSSFPALSRPWESPHLSPLEEKSRANDIQGTARIAASDAAFKTSC